MTFNGAVPTRVLTSSPGGYSGQDNGWVLGLISPVIIDFDKNAHEVSQHPALSRRRPRPI